MVLTYSGKSAPSALKIADEDSDIQLNRGSRGDVNWGRKSANTILNPNISNVTNKRVMRNLFAEHGVPMPKIVATHVGNNRLNFTPFEYPIVGRPDQHSKGRGFWKCNNAQDVQRALRGTRKKRAATHFMQFVEAPREYRVHVFLGKSIRVSEKLFDEDGDYTTGKPRHNIKHVRKAAKKALEAVSLHFGAVDILANDTECWVLEVNSSPGLGGTMPALYARVFKQWEDGEWN